MTTFRSFTLIIIAFLFQSTFVQASDAGRKLSNRKRAEGQKKSFGQISRSSAGTAKTKQASLEELWKLYSKNFPLILFNLCENENEPDFLRKVRSKKEIDYLIERYRQTYNEKDRSFFNLIYPKKT